MEVQHKNLAAGGWKELSFFEQMAHIGSEVCRAITWKNKKNAEYSRLAFDRALELCDLTVADEKNRYRLKELLRMRETLVDYFIFENSYQMTDGSWENYFHAFHFAARRAF